MFKQIVIFVLAISCVSANLNFSNCGSSAIVHALRIQGCAATPCTFVRGSTHIIEIEVTATNSAIQLPFTVHGVVPIIGAIQVLEGNACDTLIQGYCPVGPQEHLVSRIAYTVGNLLPAINLQVRATVNDQTNHQHVCIQFAATISG